MCSVEEIELWEEHNDEEKAKHTNELALKVYTMDNRIRGKFFEDYTIKELSVITQIETCETYSKSEFFKKSDSNDQPDVVFTTTENPDKPILAEVKSIRERKHEAYEISRLSKDGYKYLIIHMVCPREGLFTFSMKRSDLSPSRFKLTHRPDWGGKWCWTIPSVKYMQQQEDIIYKDYDCIIENEGLNNSENFVS